MSARGRHRRYKPSSVTRVSLRVTAGGAGIAIPLAAVQIAHAAPQSTWEKVAACESSGKWDINSGNGYFGGLQFTQSTWQAYGGTAYAARADLAGKDQQISVAEKVLKGQGPGAWPNCGPRAGLAHADAEPSKGTAVRQASVERRVEKSTAEKAAAAKAKAARAEKAEAAKARSERAAKATAERQKKQTTYEVVGGDTLSGIADDQGVDGGWRSLYAKNRSSIGGDPDLILPGQELRTTGAAEKARAAQPARPEAKSSSRTAPEKKREAEKPKAQQARPGTQKAEAKPKAQKKAGPSATAPVSGVSPSTAYRASGGSWSSGHHTGVDFPVSTGTTVKAVSGAKVVSAGWADSYGYQVVLRHSDGKYSQYAHLSAISVRSGQSVDAGQRIGRSGATGNATGPHLHFEVRTGPGYGSDVNPLTYLRGRGVQI